jgi:hypothetical protein
MFQTSVSLPAGFLGLAIKFLQQQRWLLSACAWLVTAIIATSSAPAFCLLGGGFISSRVEQRTLVWAIAETSASNQEDKKSGNPDNPDEDSGTLCVKRTDACYEDCKLSEVQPGSCNLSCTTDRICGIPVRMSYGQFLDFQVEMLAASANISPKAGPPPQHATSSPTQPVISPTPKRRLQQNRPHGVRARPAIGRPAGGSAETGPAGNGGWPQINWPRF